MAGTTPNQGYPFPTDGDVHDVAAHIEDIAMAVDADVEAVEVAVDGKVSVAGDTMTGMLTLPGANPTSLNHAVRKGWADDTYLNKTGDQMTGNLEMNGHDITGLGAPDGDNYAARKVYVDNLFSDAVKKSVTGNQTVQGVIHADAFIVTDSDQPSGPWACAPKNYVDEKFSDTHPASGNLNMGGFYIWNLDDPVDAAPHSATTREWVRGHAMMADTAAGCVGPVIVGDPREWDQSQEACRIQGNGRIMSTVTDTASSVILNRASGANAASQYYMQFNYSVDQPHGSITIETDGSGVNYNQTSDYRLKEVLSPVTDAARRVQQLAKATFRGRWRGHHSERDMLNAHDIAEVAPYAVLGEKDGAELQQVAYPNLIPLLTAALGNALDRITELKARLA